MKRWVVAGKQIFIVLGLAVLILLVMGFNNRIAELHRLSSQREQVSAKQTRLMRTQEYLQTQIAYATSETAVEEYARQEGHMIRPGDQPVVPLTPPGSTPVPTPSPTTRPEEVSSWDVWLALFFDRSP